MKIAGTSLRPLELWRRDVHFGDTRNFASSLGASLLRAGSGATVGALGARPTDTLVLYEMELCPYSRLVREALSELDLDAVIKPCPPGEKLHRGELQKLTDKTTVPYLIDRGLQIALHDSAKIVQHLYQHYGAGKPPARLSGGSVAQLSSRLASQLRGGPVKYVEPTLRPEFPLELYNYEGSPYCRIVRERLGELGLSYVSRNLARESPRRGEFQQRFGKLQFPCLYDANVDRTLFETSDILTHIDSIYAVATAQREKEHPSILTSNALSPT